MRTATEKRTLGSVLAFGALCLLAAASTAPADPAPVRSLSGGNPEPYNVSAVYSNKNLHLTWEIPPGWCSEEASVGDTIDSNGYLTSRFESFRFTCDQKSADLGSFSPGYECEQKGTRTLYVDVLAVTQSASVNRQWANSEQSKSKAVAFKPEPCKETPAPAPTPEEDDENRDAGPGVENPAIAAMRGEGTIQHQDGTHEPARLGELKPFDRIFTTRSPLKITLKDGTAVALDKKSEVEVKIQGMGPSDLPSSWGASRMLLQRRGRVWYSMTGGYWFVKASDTPDSISKTPDSIYCLDQGANCEFVFEQSKRSILMRVYSGTVRGPCCIKAKSLTGFRVKKGFRIEIWPRRGKAETEKPRRFRPLKGKPFWKL